MCTFLCVVNTPYNLCVKMTENLSMYRFFDRSRENLSRGATRDFGRDSLGLRDGSEMVVSDACVKGKAVQCYLLNLVWVAQMNL